MIIDAHAHAAGAYSNPKSILSVVKTFGIEKIVLCPSPKNNRQLSEPPKLPVKNTPDGIYRLNGMLRFAYRYFVRDNGDGNAYVCQLREALPDIIIQFLWVDPLDAKQMAGLEQNIDRYQVKGIKLHQAWNAFAIDSPEFRKVVEIAQAKGLPIFIHLYSKQETRKLLQFVRSNSNAVFLIAHMLGLDVFREEHQFLHNVYFDTSGSERVRVEDIQAAIDIFGYEHVLFGTDTPYAPITDQIRKIERLNLSTNVKDHILRRNAMTLLSLPPS